MHKSCKKKRL